MAKLIFSAEFENTKNKYVSKNSCNLTYNKKLVKDILVGGTESWPGTLRCVLGQDTVLSQCLLLPGAEMGTGDLNARGNPAMD